MTAVTGFSFREPYIEAQVRQSFDRQSLMKYVGAQIVELAPSLCVVGVDFGMKLAKLAPGRGDRL
jgi:hypothetical protein